MVAEHDPRSVRIPQFLGACFDAGLSWVHFPEGLGGLSVSRGLQAVAARILQDAGGPASVVAQPDGLRDGRPYGA